MSSGQATFVDSYADPASLKIEEVISPIERAAIVRRGMICSYRPASA